MSVKQIFCTNLIKSLNLASQPNLLKNAMTSFILINHQYMNFTKLCQTVLKIKNILYVVKSEDRYNASFAAIPDLDWSKVGVFRLGPFTAETCLLRPIQFSGKLIKVGKYVITCPSNILHEK